MSSSEVVNKPVRTSNSSSKRSVRPDRHGLSLSFGTGVLLFSIVLCYGAWMGKFASRILTTDHYQFAPVFVVAIAVLALSRRSFTQPAPQNRIRWQPLSVWLGLMALGSATLFDSPWMACVSLLLLADGLMPAFRMSRQALRLLWVLVPFPLGYDRTLILKLQSFSSQQAAYCLDAVGIPHLMSGNVLELVGKRLLVEEACSGLGSVYLLVAVAMLIVVVVQMRLVVAVPLVASAFAWAVAGNVLRIVVIAVAHAWYHKDLSVGWQHELLGVSTMLLSVGGIALTAVFLNSLMSPVSDAYDAESKISRYLTPEILWNLTTTTERVHRREMSTPGMHIKGRSRLVYWISACLLVAATLNSSQLNIRELVSPFFLSPKTPTGNWERVDKRLVSFEPSRLFPDLETTPIRSTDSQPHRRQWTVSNGEKESILTLSPHQGPYPAVLEPLINDGWSLMLLRRFPLGQPITEDGLGIAVLARDKDYLMVSFCCFRPNAEVIIVPEERLLLSAQASDLSKLTARENGEIQMIEFSLSQPTEVRPTEFDMENSAAEFARLFTRIHSAWTEVSGPGKPEVAL